jgi:DNA-binding CsgD family transcriptional regulator
LRAWIEYERSNPASGGEFLEQLHSIEAVSRSNAVFGLTPWDLKCQVLGYVYQITGDHSMLTEAEAVAAGRAAGPDGNLFQQFTGFNAVAALAAISGDRFRAAALLAEYERVAAQYDVPDLFALAIAGLHRTLGDTRKATDFYERALEYNRKSEFALMSAYASFDFTGMLIDIGDAKTLTRARNVLHTAIGLATRRHLAPHVDRLTQLLHRLTAVERRQRLGFAGLSNREREVLSLIAAGKTNSDISDRLVISENTVQRHVGNILDKLDATNRTQAASYARDHGLV